MMVMSDHRPKTRMLLDLPCRHPRVVEVQQVFSIRDWAGRLTGTLNHLHKYLLVI